MTAAIEPDTTLTGYSYDGLDNLTGVIVGGQTVRSFSYSTLSRLTSATNPESNTVTYQTYDNNGNLEQVTDANGVMTTMNYDALNRVTSKSYTIPNGSTTAPTNSVTYQYFDANNYKGALSAVCSGTAIGTCTAAANSVITRYTHDKFGRITASSQQMGTATPYAFGYQYSLTDQLTQITYPSGRKVSYALDAADRVQTVQNVATGANYASLNYTTSPGNTLTITLGNGIVEQPSFNDRLQPVGLSVTSPAPASTNLLTLGLFPCAAQATSCASGNNGNLQSQTITLPGLSVTQQYTYNNLNQLTNAQETGGGSGWNQGYQYSNGNRAVPTATHTGLPPLTLETPTDVNWYDPLTNRIKTWGYDSNGNVTQIGNVSRSFSYDAENRQVTATINGVMTNYVYDGLGQRASKTVNSQATTYVYDAFGNLAAEYGALGTSPCGTPTCYVTVDHLGSARLLTDATGLTKVRYDYQPFGAEIPAGYAGRTTDQGYMASADAFGPKFTGQTRDPETALDWFNVRYISGAQGRFQSVDPGNAGANAADPQTWNAYAYVGNNPLSYTDPSGMGPEAGLCAGGPVACGIGIGIDVGLALWRIFGGGHHTPSLANFPFPNQFPAGVGGTGGVSGCGGPLGNCGDPGGDPWSEQPPIGTAGALNVGRFGIDNYASAGAMTYPGVAPKPLAVPGWLEEVLGVADDALGLAVGGVGRLVFVVTVTGKPLNQSEIAWEAENQGRIAIPNNEHLIFSKGGKQNVAETGLWDKAKKANPNDPCGWLRARMDNARKSGDSKVFNSTKATWKQYCRGN